ncbi:unnamed protein product, partial [Brugia timori]|uniref:Glycosyltransferase family 2 protein n=1 Tax=Brugia timori TaxID=42155 RepID=A0A0R3QIP6_9BILA
RQVLKNDAQVLRGKAVLQPEYSDLIVPDVDTHQYWNNIPEMKYRHFLFQLVKQSVYHPMKNLPLVELMIYYGFSFVSFVSVIKKNM